MTTPRFPDWQARLGELLEQRREMPFAFGVNDCCTFPADCVLAVTGVDPGVGFRDHTDAAGAARRLAELGGVLGVGDKLFGSPVSPLMARVGDVGLVLIEGRESLAVCNGATWLGPGERGLVARPLRDATRAWMF